MERSTWNVCVLLAVRQLERNGLGFQLPARFIQVFAFLFQEPRAPGIGLFRGTKEHATQNVHDIAVVGDLRLHIVRGIVDRYHYRVHCFVHFLFLVFCLTVLASMARRLCISNERANDGLPLELINICKMLS